ncbi:MAG: anti-sigma factor [Actinomycetota bacterium]
MSRHDEWAAHLDPGVDGSMDDGMTLDATERAALDRIRSNLADPTVWEEPPPSLRGRLLAEAQTQVQDQAAGLPGQTPGIGTVITGGADGVDGPAGSDQDAVSRARAKARARWIGPLTAVAAAVVVFGLVFWPRADNPVSELPTYELAASALAPDATATVRSEPMGAGVEIWARFSGLAPAAPGEYYAGWLMGEAGMVSIGSFHARTDGAPVGLWSGVAVQDYPQMIITLQREGEPPGPSDAIVFEGRIVP